ncbi:MAG: hypothetical protein DRJ57_04630 [Thermoprotei archaeon]|nr:MAG: hypothetical protein DRJ57_04630 [Thermoprotei archaeon]
MQLSANKHAAALITSRPPLPYSITYVLGFMSASGLAHHGIESRVKYTGEDGEIRLNTTVTNSLTASCIMSSLFPLSALLANLTEAAKAMFWIHISIECTVAQYTNVETLVTTNIKARRGERIRG